MYGKLFSSTFTGSLYGIGPEVISVWSWVIAHTVNSHVELNPPLVAAAIGMSVEAVERALGVLTAPDPKSRSKDFDGRRLVQESEYIYLVPTHEFYRTVRNEDERRAYWKSKKAEYRDRDKKVAENTSVHVRPPEKSTVSTHTSAAASASVSGVGEPSLTQNLHREGDENTDTLRRFDQPLHREAYLHYLREARFPGALDGELLAYAEGMNGCGMVPWSLLGQAMHEMRVASRPFSARSFRAFLRDLRRAADPVAAVTDKLGRAPTLGERGYLAGLAALGVAP